jgi:hypothetical protein
MHYAIYTDLQVLFDMLLTPTSIPTRINRSRIFDMMKEAVLSKYVHIFAIVHGITAPIIVPLTVSTVSASDLMHHKCTCVRPLVSRQVASSLAIP